MNDVAIGVIIGSCACVGVICHCIQWTTNCVLGHKHITQRNVQEHNQDIMQYNMRVAMFNVEHGYSPNGDERAIKPEDVRDIPE